MELNKEDCQNLILLLNRAQITGLEAETITLLKQKLARMIQQPEKQVISNNQTGGIIAGEIKEVLIKEE